ncbi:hypothetical protein [Paracoccus salsus]|uniref:hypothetical protein n=1 Tax=Paracoccus salsus TaxID=2911061 RepID=UPI001F22C16C|nr:hypothetical protein [Paracoccus salsus]
MTVGAFEIWPTPRVEIGDITTFVIRAHDCHQRGVPRHLVAHVGRGVMVPAQ